MPKRSGKNLLDDYAREATANVNEAGREFHSQMKQAKKALNKF